MSKVTTPIASPKGEEDIEEDGEQPVKKDNRHTLYWTDQVESLLSGWADTAAVYKWLHDKSHRKYKRKNKILAIPTMILSLVTGSLGIGLQGYVPAEYMSIGPGALGGMGVFIGILQGLQTQFGFAQRSEKHSGSSLGWGKLQRNIQIELSIEREFRKDADSFVKVCRMEYDRLTEQYLNFGNTGWINYIQYQGDMTSEDIANCQWQTASANKNLVLLEILLILLTLYVCDIKK
jgi:hypothetical protein